MCMPLVIQICKVFVSSAHDLAHGRHLMLLLIGDLWKNYLKQAVL